MLLRRDNKKCDLATVASFLCDYQDDAEHCDVFEAFFSKRNELANAPPVRQPAWSICPSCAADENFVTNTGCALNASENSTDCPPSHICLSRSNVPIHRDHRCIDCKLPVHPTCCIYHENPTGEVVPTKDSMHCWAFAPCCIVCVSKRWSRDAIFRPVGLWKPNQFPRVGTTILEMPFPCSLRQYNSIVGMVTSSVTTSLRMQRTALPDILRLFHTLLHGVNALSAVLKKPIVNVAEWLSGDNYKMDPSSSMTYETYIARLTKEDEALITSTPVATITPNLLDFVFSMVHLTLKHRRRPQQKLFSIMPLSFLFNIQNCYMFGNGRSGALKLLRELEDFVESVLFTTKYIIVPLLQPHLNLPVLFVLVNTGTTDSSILPMKLIQIKYPITPLKQYYDSVSLILLQDFLDMAWILKNSDSSSSEESVLQSKTTLIDFNAAVDPLMTTFHRTMSFDDDDISDNTEVIRKMSTACHYMLLDVIRMVCVEDLVDDLPTLLQLDYTIEDRQSIIPTVTSLIHEFRVVFVPHYMTKMSLALDMNSNNKGDKQDDDVNQACESDEFTAIQQNIPSAMELVRFCVRDRFHNRKNCLSDLPKKQVDDLMVKLIYAIARREFGVSNSLTHSFFGVEIECQRCNEIYPLNYLEHRCALVPNPDDFDAWSRTVTITPQSLVALAMKQMDDCIGGNLVNGSAAYESLSDLLKRSSPAVHGKLLKLHDVRADMVYWETTMVSFLLEVFLHHRHPPAGTAVISTNFNELSVGYRKKFPLRDKTDRVLVTCRADNHHYVLDLMPSSKIILVYDGMDPSIKEPGTGLDEMILEYASLVVKQLALSSEAVGEAFDHNVNRLKDVPATELEKIQWQAISCVAAYPDSWKERLIRQNNGYACGPVTVLQTLLLLGWNVNVEELSGNDNVNFAEVCFSFLDMKKVCGSWVTECLPAAKVAGPQRGWIAVARDGTGINRGAGNDGEQANNNGKNDNGKKKDDDNHGGDNDDGEEKDDDNDGGERQANNNGNNDDGEEKDDDNDGGDNDDGEEKDDDNDGGGRQANNNGNNDDGEEKDDDNDGGDQLAGDQDAGNPANGDTETSTILTAERLSSRLKVTVDYEADDREDPTNQDEDSDEEANEATRRAASKFRFPRIGWQTDDFNCSTEIEGLPQYIKVFELIDSHTMVTHACRCGGDSWRVRLPGIREIKDYVNVTTDCVKAIFNKRFIDFVISKPSCTWHKVLYNDHLSGGNLDERKKRLEIVRPHLWHNGSVDVLLSIRHCRFSKPTFLKEEIITSFATWRKRFAKYGVKEDCNIVFPRQPYWYAYVGTAIQNVYEWRRLSMEWVEANLHDWALAMAIANDGKYMLVLPNYIRGDSEENRRYLEQFQKYELKDLADERERVDHGEQQVTHVMFRRKKPKKDLWSWIRTTFQLPADYYYDCKDGWFFVLTRKHPQHGEIVRYTWIQENFHKSYIISLMLSDGHWTPVPPGRSRVGKPTKQGKCVTSETTGCSGLVRRKTEEFTSPSTKPCQTGKRSAAKMDDDNIAKKKSRLEIETSPEVRLSHPRQFRVSCDWPIIKYPQGGEETCVFCSMANALFYMGKRETAAKINDQAKRSVGLTMKNKIELLRGVIGRSERDKFMLNHVSRYGMGKLDPLKNISSCPTLAVIESSDGACNHAVTFVSNWIFDGNEQRALPLTKESLNKCGPPAYVQVAFAYRFGKG